MNELWTEKYKPSRISEVIGQQKAVQDVLSWLSNWKPGNALLLYGPPGVGKTALVEAIAKEKNLDLLQLNASDERTAINIEKVLMDSSRTFTLFKSGKIILIDEVDGISSTDKGSIGAIIKIIKTSRFPVILVANDPWEPKLRPLRPHIKLVKFNKLHSASIEKRLHEICRSEGIMVKDNALKDLARWSQGDLRSAINDLQLVALGKKSISIKDLEVLGYRERESNIFEILPVIFKSRKINAGRIAIQSADMDPDDIFLWIENNLYQEFVKEKVPEAYDLLSKIDILRNLVTKQQNWRFKAYMIDLLAGISVVKGDTHAHRGFVPYKPPDRITLLSSIKERRMKIMELCKKIGEVVHCSSNVVKRDYLPYLKIILKKEYEKVDDLKLEEEEIELLK